MAQVHTSAMCSNAVNKSRTRCTFLCKECGNTSECIKSKNPQNFHPKKREKTHWNALKMHHKHACRNTKLWCELALLQSGEDELFC